MTSTSGESEQTSLVIDVSPVYKAGGVKDAVDFQFVQNFHKTVRRGKSQDRESPNLFVMSFAHPLRFAIEIGNDRDSWGNPETDVVSSMASDKTQKPWFKIVRYPITTNHANEEILTITNMEGEPFLSIKETDYRETNVRGGFSMDLYRSNSLATEATVGPKEQPICRVRRKYFRKKRRFAFLGAKTTISLGTFVELLGPLAYNGPSIDCDGYWPNFMKFTSRDGFEDDDNTKSNRNPSNTIGLASIRKQVFRDNKWQLNVSPEQDVLLFVGIACALELLNRKENALNVCC